MSSLEIWDPKPVINLFTTSKKRRDHPSVIENRTTRGPYFSGVVEAANEEEGGPVAE